ncbi:MAG TPA: HAD family phosphatase [Candidatus Obscuribacterales bacterium]
MVPKATETIKALIFDMDGVLVDSEPLHLLAYQELLSAFGCLYTEEDNRQYLGRKDIDCAVGLIERFRLPLTAFGLVEKKEEILHRLFREKLQLRPGVLSTLNTAKGQKLPMAVASSATLPTIRLVVETVRIDGYFRTLCSGDEVANGKPQPDVFLLAAERLGIDPGQCLVIEDTYNGVCAAKAAGMKCIAIPCLATQHQDLSHADFVMRSLEQVDLAEWL